MDVGAYNCLEILLAKAAVQLGTSYQMMVKGGWTFVYDRSFKGLIGDKISCRQRENFIEAFQKYHEVSVIEHKLELSNFLCSVHNWLSMQIPVIVNTDSFWCPWSSAYQKRHYLHSFSVVGINENESVCSDPYITEKKLYVSLTDIYPGVRHCFTVHRKNNLVTTYNTILALQEDICFLLKNGNSAFNAIHTFADEVKNINIMSECQNYKKELYASPIFEKLKNVMWSRRGYSYMLQNIARLCRDESLNSLAEQLFCVSKTWEEVRGRMIQCYLREDNQGAQLISNKIHEISRKEEFLAYALSRLIGDKYLLEEN